ncbi:MAG: hypothetical protein AAF151_05885 [Cyanobacteria bacterium J06656_5]
MNKCLCCHTSLLRHIRHSRIYWYCSTCRQDMPQTTTTAVSQSFPMAQRHQPDTCPPFYVPSLPVTTKALSFDRARQQTADEVSL